MASDALFVVGPAVATIAAYRVDLAVDHVQRQIITPMDQFAIRSVAELDWRFHFGLIGVAVIAERTGMTDGAQQTIPSGVKTVLSDELG